MHAGSHQTGDVGHVHQQEGTHLIGDRTQRREINEAAVGASPRHDHLRAELPRLLGDRIVVHLLGIPIDPIVGRLVQLAGEADARTMGKMPAHAEVEPKDLVANTQQSGVDAQVGLSAGVGLHIDVLGPEERLGPIDGQLLDLVHHLAPAVVAMSWIALGVLVVEMVVPDYPVNLHGTSHRLQHRLTGVVLRGDQLDGLALPAALFSDQPRQFAIRLFPIDQ